MSVQGQIFDFMRNLRPEGDGHIPATANQIALQTGFERDKVNKTLFNLNHTGKIELVRGPNGRDIIGYRLLVTGPVRTRRTPVLSRPAAMTVHPTRSGRVRAGASPNIDAYATAKERFEAMRAEFGGLVEATFNENPYAEEGLRLKQRHGVMEARYGEMQHELEAAQRDLRHLRTKKHAEMAEAVIKEQVTAD